MPKIDYILESLRHSCRATLICMSAILLIGCLLFSFGVSVYAHPGGTDSDGGHTCWTDCEDWGLEYGEYHYHDEGGYTGAESSTPSIIAQGRINGSRQAQDTRQQIEAKAISSGSIDGKRDGGRDDATFSYTVPDLPDEVCHVEFEFSDDTPAEYRDGYYQSWSNTCNSIAISHYKDHYRQAYDEAYENRESEHSTEENDAGDESGISDYVWILAAIGVFYGAAIAIDYIVVRHDDRKASGGR